MNSEINILPIKTGSEGLASTSTKVNKTDSASFEKVLQDAKIQSDNGVQTSDNSGNIEPNKGEVLEKLDKAIQFFTEALGDKNFTPEQNAELQKLLGLLKSFKMDVKAGKAEDSSLIKKLFASLSDVKKILTTKDEHTQDDQLEKLREDFKKKFGTNPIDYIQTMVQAVVQPVVHPVMSTSEKNQVQSGKSLTPLTPMKKSGKPEKAAKPQIDSPKPMSNDAKVVTDKAENKAENKAKLTVIGKTSSDNKQSTANDGESKSSPSNQLKSQQWVLGGPVHKIQQFILHSVPKTQSPSDQISNQVRAVISKGMIKPLPDGGMELTIKLHPGNLGTVQVVLSQTAAGLQATLLTQSQSTKDLLQSQLSQLKQSFATLGINVQKLDVGQFNQPQPQSQSQQNPSQFNGQAFQQSAGDGHGGQRRDREDAHKIDTEYYDLEPETSFDEWLKEGGII